MEEGELELKDHHFATIIVKICSGKSNCCMLNVAGNFDAEQSNGIVLKLSLRDFKGKCNYTVVSSDNTTFRCSK